MITVLSFGNVLVPILAFCSDESRIVIASSIIWSVLSTTLSTAKFYYHQQFTDHNIRRKGRR